jgi:hypothetical protein
MDISSESRVMLAIQCDALREHCYDRLNGIGCCLTIVMNFNEVAELMLTMAESEDAADQYDVLLIDFEPQVTADESFAARWANLKRDPKLRSLKVVSVSAPD